MNETTLFEIINLQDLSFRYRLLAIEGLSTGDNFDRQINLIKRGVAYELRQPVALVKRDGQPYLALPADAELPALERPLTPHVAMLIPQDEVLNLNFADMREEDLSLALRLLSWAFQSRLRNRGDLWGNNHAYFWKKPQEQTFEVQMFRGFRFRVVPLPEGRLALGIDLAHKYADSRWLSEYDWRNLSAYRMRHCLYHFGQQWYTVQLINPLGQSISEQKFQPDGAGTPIDVYSYTRQKCGTQFVQDLDPQSPALLYRYPGSEQERFGAAALCKLLFKTDEPAVRGLHQRSILPPNVRRDKIKEVIGQYFHSASLGGMPIRLSGTPAQVRSRHFVVPDLLFGHGKRLHVKRGEENKGILLKDLGQARMQGLLGKDGGTYVSTPFDTQYLLLPDSLPTAIQDDFRHRLMATVDGFYAQSYQPQVVLYEDKGRSSLVCQGDALRSALQRANAGNGYAVLVLPENADANFHNYVKQKFWPRLQFQCASARSIRSHYWRTKMGKEDQWVVSPQKQNAFRSYMRYLALGALLVNRKWPFMLAEPLHYDLYIGIDVLNNAAGFTFFYPAEGKCHFHHETSQQKEKLTKKQVGTIIYEQLKLLLQDCKRRPRSIVFLRDGISFSGERQGAYKALKRLRDEDRLLEDGLITGTVEVHKQSAIPFRLFDVQRGLVHNPRIGDAAILNKSDGFISTTGFPFSGRGTVSPLHIRLVDGPLDIEWVLEDVLAQATLSWSAPDRCSRHPVVISLCDMFLQPIASKVVEEDDEGDEEVEDDDDAEWR